MVLGSSVFQIFQQPTIGSMLFELVMFMAPIWIAICVGVLVGWVWRPKWASLVRESESESANNNSMATCSNSLSPSSSCSSQSKILSLDSLEGASKGKTLSQPSANISACSTAQSEKELSGQVTEDDLEHLCRLVEMKDGGPAWIQMMDRSMPTMSYQAWRRDPETGPPQYRSRTVFEDATPELVRDFFWDDSFRPKWDDMLIHAQTLEECPTTGTMMVQWVRKFPFFCSDREYIIGRRIWESGRSYYCVTKGVPNSVPRQNKPRRVDLFYSSWCIRAVESNRGDGQLTACEVLLFHHEDMGIPWEIAKLGVRQGMWGAVKKIEPGLRAYQKERTMGAALSRCAYMAQINSKVSADYLKSLESSQTSLSEIKTQELPEKKPGNNIPKLLFVGGAIAIACSLDRGLVTKAVIFGVARRLGNIGRRI